VEEITLLASAAQRHGRTVLVIDDEEGVRTLVARTLERDGVATLVAADGQMGVDLFRSRAPEIDGVILDMTMPRMSGRETCQAIWQIRPEVPVVLISGYSAQEIAGAFPEAALAAVLQKPFRTTDLRTAVRRMLDGET
jgi:CheY-like chemotaxis protein